MDAVEPSTDFQDWELLQANSDTETEKSLPEIDSGGLIQPDYFSLDAQNSFGEDGKLAISDNPSWIEPELEQDPARYLHKESADFWSDSNSERSEDRKFTDLERGDQVGFLEIEALKVGSGDVESIAEESGEKESRALHFDSGEIGIGGAPALEGSGVEDIDQILHPDTEMLGEQGHGCNANQVNEVVESENTEPRETEKKEVVWWKMPMEFLKYCVFRMSPVWSVSIAAAVMGFVILSRRLYKMRNKARALEVKVTVDDKKVSQVMSRAARLNEAFSIVRLVPVIRFSTPAVGSLNPWPVMSLR